MRRHLFLGLIATAIAVGMVAMPGSAHANHCTGSGPCPHGTPSGK